MGVLSEFKLCSLLKHDFFHLFVGEERLVLLEESPVREGVKFRFSKHERGLLLSNVPHELALELMYGLIILSDLLGMLLADLSLVAAQVLDDTGQQEPVFVVHQSLLHGVACHLHQHCEQSPVHVQVLAAEEVIDIVHAADEGVLQRGRVRSPSEVLVEDQGRINGSAALIRDLVDTL